jgi:hypothetical protein
MHWNTLREQALDCNGLGSCPKPDFNVRVFTPFTKIHCVTSRQTAVRLTNVPYFYCCPRAAASVLKSAVLTPPVMPFGVSTEDYRVQGRMGQILALSSKIPVHVATVSTSFDPDTPDCDLPLRIHIHYYTVVQSGSIIRGCIQHIPD